MIYRIIGAGCRAELELDVNKAIKLGWKPIGGICCDSPFSDSSDFYQAMIFGGKE